jgi:FAD binding domain
MTPKPRAEETNMTRHLGDELRRTVRGRVTTPDDPAFGEVRMGWNRAVDQRVRAVVEVADAADAAALVGYARLAGLSLAMQPNGHGATADLSDAILVRTGALRSVTVDPVARTARVEAGASWGDVLAMTGKHGLLGLAGSSPAVGATGFCLGGGLSWFGRRHGFAASSVRALEVVDAEGVPARVTAASDPDLFWALRGGGGDFALVTAMELDLYPVPSLYGGRIVWPATRAAAVLEAFTEVTAQAPEELSVWCSLLDFPPFLPPPLGGLSGVVIDAVHLGSEAAGRGLLARFEAIPGMVLDTRQPMPITALGDVCAEPTDPTPTMFRSELLTRLDSQVTASMLAAAGQGSVAPLTSVQIRHLGGALGRPSPDAGACGHLDEPYAVGMLAVTPTPEARQAAGTRIAALCSALTPYTSGRKPLTFCDDGERAASAFPAGILARLREIKRRRDPSGVFRSNFPVLG